MGTAVKKIGEYQIVEKIGAGGMATVFKGVQQSLKRPVAIKVLNQKFSDHPDLVERFNRESLIIARLTHPNIIHVIDRGITAEGRPYFVMDFVEGTDTARIIREGNLPLQPKLDILIQVCKALSYAHKNGIVHRDIKPANILIDSEGNALVADFGIAQFFGMEGAENQLTAENIVLGTLAYMSPEQKTSSRSISAKSDLYSLGVVMYELLTGAKPLGNFKPPSQMNGGVPKEVDGLILQCLDPEPENRPDSANAVKDQLLQMLQGAHIKETKKREAAQGVTKMEDIFTLLDIIKEHRFGAVYLLRHKVNEQLMVVKRYSIPLGGFKSAKLLTNLKHPNIVNIYGVSGSKTHYIIVMEYLSGGSLADRMVIPHKWESAVLIMKQICDGISFAHRNRIVHGNLRPSNIMFSADDQVKITDFGLNEHYALDPDKANWFNTANQPRSRQADLCALGAIFYKMLTGAIPELKGSSIVMHKAFKVLPKDVQRIVLRMLTSDSNLRFRSVDQARDALEGLLPDQDTLLEETISMEEEPQKAAVKAEKVVGQPRFRPLLTAVLMLLFILAAATYLLVSTQELDYGAAARQIGKVVMGVFR